VNSFEIWDKEAYEKVITTNEEDFAKLAEEVMGDLNFDDRRIIIPQKRVYNSLALHLNNNIECITIRFC
jgi:hypothetical protein